MNNELNNNGMNNQTGQPNNGFNNVPNQPYSGPVPIQPVNSPVPNTNISDSQVNGQTNIPTNNMNNQMPNENINGNISNGPIPTQPVNNQNNQAINGQSNITPNPINEPVSQPSPMPNNQNLNNQPVNIGEDKKDNKNIIKIVGIAVAVIVVLFIIIKLFGGSGAVTATSTGGSNNKVLGNLYADIPSNFVLVSNENNKAIYNYTHTESSTYKVTTCNIYITKTSTSEIKNIISKANYSDKGINGINWKVGLIDNTNNLQPGEYIKKYMLFQENGYAVEYEIYVDDESYCQNEVEGFYNSLAIK